MSRRYNERRTSSKSKDAEVQMLKDRLDRLIKLNEAQTSKMVPEVPDVPRMKLAKNRVFTASFSYNAPAITSTSTAETQGAIVFTLAAVPGYTSWTQSFDAYRIVAAYVEFVPFGITPSANTTLGQIATAIDYDDSSAVPQMTLFQYDSAMLIQSGAYFERRVVPRAAKALYSGVAFTGYGQDSMTWIDSDSPSVQHYGIKYSQSVSNTAQTGYTPLVTLVVNFRNNN